MRQGGFTLGELLVTLAVASVLLVGGVPGFTALQRESRLTTVTNEFVTALHLARSEAVKRGRRVTLCASADGLACGSAKGYSDGWLVFEDRDADGSRSPGEPILRAYQDPGVLITGNQPVRDYVAYISLGTTRSVSGALQMGTITLCVPPSARLLVIASTGRPRVERGAC